MLATTFKDCTLHLIIDEKKATSDTVRDEPRKILSVKIKNIIVDLEAELSIRIVRQQSQELRRFLNLALLSSSDTKLPDGK